MGKKPYMTREQRMARHRAIVDAVKEVMGPLYNPAMCTSKRAGGPRCKTHPYTALVCVSCIRARARAGVQVVEETARDKHIDEGGASGHKHFGR
jgi:hypothetical protein